MGQLNNIQVPAGGGLNFPVEWVERIDDRSPGAEQFSVNQSHAELVALLPWEKRYDAICGLLGYQYVDPVTLKLRRVLPARHPVFSWAHASKITSMRGVRYEEKVNKVALGAGAGAADKISAYAKYRYVEFAVTFEGLPYRVRRDDQIQEEYDRFVSVEIEPGEEVYQQQAGELIFAEGNGGTEPTAGAGGTRFSQSLGLISARSFIRLHWHKVPLSFISPDGLTFPHWDALLGKVNNAAYLGKPAGTLLFRPPRVSIYAQSINPRDAAEPSLLADVVITLGFTDPTPRESDTYRGFNILPFKDRKFYLVTSTGAVDGARIYEPADFAPIFRHWSA